MTVAAILKQKGSEAVFTLPASATLGEAVEALAAHRVGALVISPDGAQVEGIFSERDVVRALAREGRGALDKAVAHFMTREVTGCQSGDTSESLMRRMTEGRFRHMPVMEDGRLRAMISIGDVVKHRISEMEMEKTALEDMIKGF